MKKPHKSRSHKPKKILKPKKVRKTKKVLKPKKIRKPKESRKTKIKKIINTIECSKNFKCYGSKFKELCKAKDIGLKSFLLCLEEDHQCDFTIFFIDEYLCKCPLRVYVAKELKK